MYDVTSCLAAPSRELSVPGTISFRGGLLGFSVQGVSVGNPLESEKQAVCIPLECFLVTIREQSLRRLCF